MFRRYLLFLILSLCAAGAWAQSIVTYAGGGTGEGQSATNIAINAPRGLAFDHAGNVYLVLNESSVMRIDATTKLVRTVVGTGTSGFGGDGGLAVNAALNHPLNIVFDDNDDLFIADTDNGRVRRVDGKTGIISTFAGGGNPPIGNGDGSAATNATLQGPFGLAIRNGFLYVSEAGAGGMRVRRVDMTSGVIDTFAGSGANLNGGFSGDGGPATQAEFKQPCGLAFDAAGNLYIADDANDRVRRVDTNGIITTYAGGGTNGNDNVPATKAGLGSVPTLAFDAEGNLVLVADPYLRRVDKTTGLITTVVNNAGFPYGLAFDASGTMYFDYADSEVVTLAPGGTSFGVFAGGGKFVGDGHPATAAILHHPQGMVRDTAGNLYIADYDGNVVRRITPDGTISTYAGMPGDPTADDQEGVGAPSARIGYPNDLALDPAGNLYISDSWNGRVWRVDQAGVLTSYAGGGDPDDGFGDGLNADDAIIAPNAIVFDQKGNLYIADDDLTAFVSRAVVRRVDTHRVITTVAGSYYPGYSGDGGRATDAQLNGPAGLAIAPDGSLYISDFNNGALRRVGPDGRISSISKLKAEGAPLGDGGPVAAARLRSAHLFIDPIKLDVYLVDRASNRIRRIDRNGIIHTVAGSDLVGTQPAFGGDGGPAIAAKLGFTNGDFSGIVVSPAGDVFFSDSQNNRIRVVFACGGLVNAPQLNGPADNTANVPAALQLTWSAASGALHYDVLLDTNTPPVKTVAGNVDGLSFTPSNLATGTKYYWQVVAKGDGNCPNPVKTPSSVRSFTTAGTPPPHTRIAPH